jgi:hypothetical protein
MPRVAGSPGARGYGHGESTARDRLRDGIRLVRPTPCARRAGPHHRRPRRTYNLLADHREESRPGRRRRGPAGSPAETAGGAGAAAEAVEQRGRTCWVLRRSSGAERARFLLLPIRSESVPSILFSITPTVRYSWTRRPTLPANWPGDCSLWRQRASPQPICACMKRFGFVRNCESASHELPARTALRRCSGGR